jgi:hypothetical protein
LLARRIQAIELAPPTVAGVAYFALTGGAMTPVAYALGGYPVLMALVQLRLLPVYARLSFSAGFRAFPYSAAATDAPVDRTQEARGRDRLRHHGDWPAHRFHRDNRGPHRRDHRPRTAPSPAAVTAADRNRGRAPSRSGKNANGCGIERRCGPRPGRTPVTGRIEAAVQTSRLRKETSVAGTETGVVNKLSRRSVADTVAHLTAVIDAKGLKLFAVIDQSEAARQARLRLRDTWRET